MHVAYEKSLAEIASEWDSIAPLRASQISSGEDISYHRVLVPCVKRLCGDLRDARVLDAGCGTGFLTAQLADIATSIVGVDVSSESIKIAREVSRGKSNVSYYVAAVEEFSERKSQGSFDVVVANMMLMTVPSLDRTVVALSKLLRHGGHLVFTITHPCFWPQYWNYANEQWFDYGRELVIEAPFKISRQVESSHITTHIHRPLHRYIGALHDAGFEIEQLDEPMPSDSVQDLYPEHWRFPRFLGSKLRKARSRDFRGEVCMAVSDHVATIAR